MQQKVDKAEHKHSHSAGLQPKTLLNHKIDIPKPSILSPLSPHRKVKKHLDNNKNHVRFLNVPKNKWNSTPTKKRMKKVKKKKTQFFTPAKKRIELLRSMRMSFTDLGYSGQVKKIDKMIKHTKSALPTWKAVRKKEELTQKSNHLHKAADQV